MSKYIAKKHFKLGSGHFNPGDELPAKAVEQLKRAHGDGNLEMAVKQGFIAEVAEPAAKDKKPEDKKPDGK